MRFIALIAAIILVPGTAVAGSITTVSSTVDADGSILVIGCPACTAKAEKPKAPPLAPGHEIVRLERVDGKAKVYRTGNWLGGSPVTFVRTASEADLALLKRQGIDIASRGEQPLAPTTLAARAETDIAVRDGIDRKAKTGSVNAGSSDAGTRLDTERFTLRLDPIQASE